MSFWTVRKKTVVFPETGVAEYLSKNQMVASLRNGSPEFLLLTCVEEEKEIDVRGMLVVHDFLDIFSNDVSRLPPMREIEFFIDIVPGAGVRSSHVTISHDVVM